MVMLVISVHPHFPTATMKPPCPSLRGTEVQSPPELGDLAGVILSPNNAKT